MATTDPSPHVTAALLEPAPPSGASAQARELYAELQRCIQDYRAATASSRSFEGSSISQEADTAARQIAEYHAAYRSALAASDLPPGTDPALLARPRGRSFTWSSISLPT